MKEEIDQEVVEQLLEWLPEKFVAAHRAGEEAYYDPTDDGCISDAWVPSYDADRETFIRYSFDEKYSTEGGILYAEMWMCDEDGDWDCVDSAPVGSLEHKDFDDRYGCKYIDEAWAKYEQWVYDTGQDPLGEYLPYRSKYQGWTLHVQILPGGNYNLIRGRKDRSEPGDRKARDLTADWVPAHVIPKAIQAIVERADIEKVLGKIDRGELDAPCISKKKQIYEFTVGCDVEPARRNYKQQLRAIIGQERRARAGRGRS